MTDQLIQRRNAMYPRRHPRGRAKTSARAIRLKQRQADVLTYRMNGHSYAAIGKQLGISPDTAWRDAVAAMARIVPVETAQQVLKIELARLDALEAALFHNATDGDIAAVDACLRIQNQRCRLMGLFPDQKHGGVHVNIGGDPAGPNAETEGVQITFVKPSRWWGREDTNKATNAKLLDLPVVNGGSNGSKP